MNFTHTNTQEAQSGNPYNLTKEQLLEGRQHLLESFVRLLSCHHNHQLYWLGTQTDLIEIVYLVYTLRIMRRASGQPCSFSYLVRRACAVLHTPEPYNPSTVAQRAIHRKGIRQALMVERYAWQKCVAGIENPLYEEIRIGTE
jgi:hypothetical protein